jgi:hypothetical protein
MLAQKTGPRNGTLFNIYLFLIIALTLVVLGLVLPRLLIDSQQATASGAGYTIYHNENYRYSISYPSKWQMVPPIPNTNVTTIASNIAPPEMVGGRYSIKSMTLPTPTAMSANNFSKIDIVSYEFEEPMSAVEFLATRSSTNIDGKILPIKIAGQDALLVEVQTAEALAQREENLIYKSVFVTKGNYGFIIAGFADTATFDHILQSFEINE